MVYAIKLTPVDGVGSVGGQGDLKNTRETKGNRSAGHVFKLSCAEIFRFSFQHSLLGTKWWRLWGRSAGLCAVKQGGEKSALI